MFTKLKKEKRGGRTPEQGPRGRGEARRASPPPTGAPLKHAASSDRSSREATMASPLLPIPTRVRLNLAHF